MSSEKRPISEHFAEIYGTGLLLGTGVLSNVAQRYPPFSRLPTLAFMGVVGYFLGYGCKQFAIRRKAEEDLAIWDYVAQHPEDFPELERPKKYKDVLLPWNPLR